MVAGHESGATAYTELRQRATLYVRESGGAVPEDTLIAHVFGGGGNPGLWRPLLRQILTGHDDIVLRSDGCWSDPTNARLRNETFPSDFVVLDVETTGLKPYRQRIIEVGVIRYVNGVRSDIYSTLVNPERRVPTYISQLTGIDDTMLADAPLFQQVAGELTSFIGDALVIGYNVGFDLGFVNAELKRIDAMSLINDSLDLLPLASQILSGIRRPGLDGLCRALDIAQRERHRALADAEATALVFGRMLDVARERGLSSIEDLQRAAAVFVPTPKRRDSVGRGRAVLDRSHLDGVPSSPGVYLMMDVRERVIYVGKAKNLRNRLSSYYSQPLGYTRKMDGLLESIERIEIIQTGSELEALLLESQLILRYQPQFNRQLRNTESYRYIKIDISNSWPRVTLTRQRNPDGSVYFGPFRVANAAKTTVELVNDTFKLRTCTRSFKNSRSYGSPCLQLSLGKCPGPCVGSADREAYRRTIHDVIGFLRGEQSEAIELIQQHLAEAAEQLDFERAARLRDRMRRVRHLILSQQILDDAVERGNLIIVTPSVDPEARELLLVVRGRLWAQFDVDPRDAAEDVSARLEQAWQRSKAHPDPGVDHDSLDQVHILERWLRKHTGHPAVILLRGDPDWRAVIATARLLSIDELTVDHIDASAMLAEPDEATESFAPSDAVC